MLKRRIRSFKFAFTGIGEIFKNQPNAKIHFIAAILVIALGFVFKISATEWCLLILAIAGVTAAEAFNTALEHLTNLVSPEYHPLAGKTKDAAAGGVLLMAIGAALLGLIIFLPKIMVLFFGI
ncbi:MAG: diacylglycerol kinase [Saprospiraceae bacterium]|nr:MAG: diacylglycerol kinase [Saprospiraceae bacterium]